MVLVVAVVVAVDVVVVLVLVVVEAEGLELLGLGAVVPTLGPVEAGAPAPGSVSMVPSGLLAFEPRLF